MPAPVDDIGDDASDFEIAQIEQGPRIAAVSSPATIEQAFRNIINEVR